ncbi:MAG TPA: Calx-beta domain-containing protein [Acidimicrobiia bacterium]|nr:Calx-beta domain-containing protein [Acidimicrobiia bacterium]
MTALFRRLLAGDRRFGVVALLLAVLQFLAQLAVATPAQAATGTVSINSVSRTEADLGSRHMTFTVTRSGGSGSFRVNYTTHDTGSATDGKDFAGTSSTLFFGANQNTATLDVDVLGDLLDEDDETFTVELTDSTDGVTLGTATGTGTIVDDDAPPAISVTGTSTQEGNAGTTPATFILSLSAPSGRAVSVQAATMDGSANAPADYTPTQKTVTFAAGDLSQSVPVPVAGDTVDENDETFTLTLSSPTNATLADSSATGTIVDDDGPPSASIADVTTANESGTASFPVTLSAPSGQPVTVSARTTGVGTASVGADYQAKVTNLTFGPGETTKPFDVPLVDDGVHEPNETFEVIITSTDAAIGRGTATGTITDDDPLPTLSINSVAKPEGNVGVTPFNFTVTLDRAASAPVTVAYAAVAGTAESGDDFADANGTVVFTPGLPRQQTVTVNVVADTFAEGDETFTVVLSNPSANAQVAPGAGGAGLGTIQNDDGTPAKITIDDATVTEGTNANPHNQATFTVHLTPAVARQVTLNYVTKDGTAVAGADFAGVAVGVISIPANSTSATISVSIEPDAIDEIDESFTVELSSPRNAVIEDGTATGAITDDDDPPSVSITPAAVTVPEGNTGASSRTLNVTLSAPSGKTISVTVATADGTATGKDYIAIVPPTTYTFAPGETVKPVPVSATGDTLDENDETFTVNLASPVNATVAGGTTTVTITDDDAPPTITIGDAELVEPDTGTAPMSFTVSLSSESGKTVSVKYATQEGTAKAPGDYASRTNATVTINPGALSGTITISIAGDTNATPSDAPTETFTVELSNPQNAVFAPGTTTATGTGTIFDNDGPPTLSVTDTTVVEGTGAPAVAVLTVRLLPAAGSPTAFHYDTADATAKAPGDYTATSADGNIPAGETTATIQVPVAGDGSDEADETFTVALSSTTPVDPNAGTAEVTITDDDGPVISVNDLPVTEGNSGSQPARFVVSLSAPSPQPVQVAYATAAGTAVSPDDFTAANGVVTFDPGQQAKEVSPAPSVVGDTSDELDETFSLTLSGPVNGTIAKGVGVATIVDDDQRTLTVADVSTGEGDGAGAVTFTLALDEPTVLAASVAYTTADGSAVAGADYAPISGRVIFAPGQSSRTIVVPVVGDVRDEVDETVRLVLSSPANLTLGRSEAVGTILDDDKPGYHLVATDGGIFSYGGAGFYGSTGALKLNQPIVGMATTPTGRGYWLVATDGGIFAFGDARFFGSTGAIRLNRPIVGMAPTPTGDGYWLVATDGGIFAFGGAKFAGSTGAIKLNKPIVGMAATPSGKGYWLVATDGGIFAFGDAAFQGSTGAVKLNQPIVAMAATPSGKGYWLVATDGGIFAFGDAKFFGSTGNIKLNKPIVGMAPTASGKGYWLVATDGGIFSFGDATFLGSTGALKLNRPVVGMAAL